MNEEMKDKLLKGRKDKNEKRTFIKIDNIVIKSYENGWILNIGNEGSRYYSNLLPVFKSLFDIKLSRTYADTLQTLNIEQKRIYKEIEDISCRIEKILRVTPKR